MLPVRPPASIGASGPAARVSLFGMRLERARFALVAEPRAPRRLGGRLESPPRDALTQRARTSLARRAHKACADSEAIHFCDRPGSAILDWSGHAIGPKGVRRLGDHSPV
jgi:hypothetical protein